MVDVGHRRRRLACLPGGEEFTRRVVESSPDCLKVLDLDGRLLWMSEGGQRLMEIDDFGLLLYARWSHCWSEAARETVEEAVRTAASGGRAEFEGFCVTAKGTPKWWHVVVTPIVGDDGLPERLLSVSRDITALKRAEAELLEADRRKDEFLALLAHELRNPLAPIRTGLELLRLSADDPEVVEETCGLMERQARQLVRLVDDLLDVSRITRGKVELRKERIDLAEVVRTAVEEVRPQMDEHRHQFSVTLPGRAVTIDADPHRLAQVLANLLDNAAKYTPPGGRITLSAETDGGDLVVAVRDDGVGIPPQMLGRIFDTFTQVGRTFERTGGGLGLGLALVKNLVEMHGGGVEAKSEGEGQGSEFVVRLPVVVRPSERDGSPDDAPEAAVSKRRVLVVDDNEDAARMLGMVLKTLGHEVTLAHDGEQAVEAAETLRPGVVLMDLGMPRLDGCGAARRIRERPWGREIMLVALTGWGQDEDRRRTRDAGFDRHLVKPVEPTDLRDLLAEVEPVRV